MHRQTIEVIGCDMQCFKVDADTLKPVSSSYYEHAAWSDPRGPQMSAEEWNKRLAQKRYAEMREYFKGRS